MLNYRYPGVKPFQPSESSLFFGRETDIQDLYDLVLVEKLVVLFGKSGYGKSSLINAGLLPKLAHPKMHRNRPFIPLLIRFGSYSADNSRTPTQKVIEKLTQICPQDSHFLFEQIWEKTNTNKQTLWYYFKRIQAAKPQKFVLIFDQFEEFFTYPLEQQTQFRQQIAELLYTEIPQNLRNEWDSFTDEEKLYLSEDLLVKTLFSIREDRLSWLNTLKHELPAILHKRFELKGLNLAQAEAAIVRPATLPMSAGFASPPFRYDPAALSQILDALQASHAQNTPSVIHLQKATIEAFLLQISCESIEKKIIEQYKTTPSVRAENQAIIVTINDLPNFEKIYEDYYYRKIEELPTSSQAIAKYVIEEDLIIEDANTNTTFRTTADERKLLEKYNAKGLTSDLLRLMVDAFLLRAEPNVFGFFNYEISHDTLLAPILKSKKQRKDSEKIHAFQQRQIEAQAEAEAERLRRKESERLHALTRKTLKINKIIAAFLALALVAVVFLWQLANYKKREAQCQQYTFESLLSNEFDRTKALYLLKQAYHINPDTTFGKIYSILSDTFNAAFNPYYAASLEAHNDILTDVKISDDQKHILTASKDKTLKMWDLQGNLLKNFAAHQGKIMNVIFLDNQHFLSASEDSTLKIWNIEQTTPLHSFFENIAQKQGYVIALALSPQKNCIALGTQQRIILVPFNNDFSKNKNLFDEKKYLYLFDNEGYDQVCALTFSTDGVLLATSHLDQKIRIWRTDNGKLLKTLRVPNLYKSLVFSPDNEFLYAGGDDAQICRFSIKNNNFITWKAHENYVLSLRFLPNENILLSSSADKTIKMWQCEPLTTPPSVKAIFKGHNGEIFQIAVSNDASFFVSASADHKARVWHYNYAISKNIDKENLIDTIFSSNQQYDAFIRSGTNILHLKRQGQTSFKTVKLPFLVNDATISQQKNYIVFKHLNNIITLWDLDKEASLQKLTFEEPLLEKVGLSENAHYFFIYTKNNQVIKIPTALHYLGIE